MADSQWCLDECPTCATVVHGRAIYCSPECEPEMEPQLRPEEDKSSVDSSTYISSSISTGPVAETLVAGSIGLPSPKSSCGSAHGRAPPPGPPSRPLLTKTNVYLFSNSTTHPLLPHSNETSDRPGTPSEKWIPTAVVEAECSRTPDRRRRDGRPTFRSRTGP
ncbi:hypothetical protein C8F04DRAFT_1167528 [Mycena alexandri]|uniref:Uncharacterized protein n=1 Tax=Mycena alexandri TaxID=1745969 RepID=A0AAD6WKX3_9AGAR|nr:hypothetical protein C8F04DRAFT_1167528 [Mycena alexandri]